MQHKLMAMSICVAGLMAGVPNTAEAQSLGDLVGKVKRNVERIERIVETGDIADAARDGGQSVHGDSGVFVLERSPMLAGTEHLMLVKVDSPVTQRGTYRVILRALGTRGRAGIRSNTYLSDADLDEAGTHVVVRVDAPDTPGRYELQITREDVDDVISSTPVSVDLDARPIIGGLPESAGRGQRVPVSIGGGRYYFNRISFVQDRRTAKAVQYDAIITSEGEYLVMPTRAGQYDLVVRYRGSDGEDRQLPAGRITVR